MNRQSPFLSITLLLLSLVIISVVSYFGIQYFSFEPSGIQTSSGEFSLGVSSKLGWILTAGFVVLMMIFLLLRRLVDKIQGKF